MSKTLAKAALVVGAVALVASGVGAAAGAGLLGATTLAAGASAATVSTLATIATVATVASVAAGVLSLAAGLTAKKPSAQATGSQTSFSADPDAGIPYVVGRTGTAGNIIFRSGFDTADKGDNDRQAFVAALSLGPVQSVGGMTVDRSPVSFASGAALGAFAGFMWSMTQVGALPSPALGFGAGAGSPPGWTAQHKLSGLAAASWTLRFDTKAKLFQNGVPAPMWVVEGGLAYDPRLDSTYPGGSGPHRMADPADTAAYDAAVATWSYTENPYLHALKWVHGVWQRDKNTASSPWQRVMGMGAPLAGIDVAAFVDGANIADANGWKVGGVVYSGDGKWDTLKKILQAGMGEPLALGARMSCLVNAPKVSLATITIDDVIGDASVGATQPRRDRINTITPRYRLEQNSWQLLPGSPISVAEHVATDRGKRSKVQDYPFIQDSSQVGTAVRYDIENAREFGPIVLPLKLVWMGYKPGDCVTVDLPELGLNGQPILLLNRELDPSAGVVTMTARSETAAKHPFALGQTATPPPTPGVTGATVVPVPADGAWAITGTELSANGTIVPALIVTGATDIGSAEAVVFEYRPFVSGQAETAAWRGASPEPATTTRRDITSVAPGSSYEVGVSYQVRGVVGARRILGPVTTVALITDQATKAKATADAAKAAADKAQAAAEQGARDAAWALSELEVIQSDGWLAAGEKPEIIRQWTAILAERDPLRQQGLDLGLTLGPAGVPLDGYLYAHDLLRIYLRDLAPPHTDTAHDTAIDPVTFNQRFTDYYAARTRLLNAMAARAAATATWEQVSGGGKDALIAQAADAQGKANSALSSLSIIAADNYLSAGEKPEVIREFGVIAGERGIIYAKAQALGLPTGGGSMADTFAVAYDALSGYLNGLAPPYSSTTTDTPIVPATFRGRFADYYGARTNLINAMIEHMGQTALWDQVTGAGKEALVAQAADAQAKANSSLSKLSIIAADDYLSGGEKSDLIREVQIIIAERPIIYGKAAALGLPTGGGSPADAYAYVGDLLLGYLNGLAPAYTNTDTDTPIAPATFRGRFADYYAARTTLLNAMADAGKQLIDTATGRATSSAFLTTGLLLGLKAGVSDVATAADQGGGTGATISIPAHTRTYATTGGPANASYNAGSLTNRAYDTLYYVYADDPALTGGAVTYQTTTDYVQLAYTGRIHVATIITPSSGGAAATGSGGSGSGSTGYTDSGGGRPRTYIP